MPFIWTHTNFHQDVTLKLWLPGGKSSTLTETFSITQAMDGGCKPGDHNRVPVVRMLSNVSKQFSSLQLYEHDLGFKRPRLEDADEHIDFAQECTESHASTRKKVKRCGGYHGRETANFLAKVAIVTQSMTPGASLWNFSLPESWEIGWSLKKIGMPKDLCHIMYKIYLYRKTVINWGWLWIWLENDGMTCFVSQLFYYWLDIC